MRSPVSTNALGECNAIRSRGLSRNELTLSATWKPHSALMSASTLPTCHVPVLELGVCNRAVEL